MRVHVSGITMSYEAIGSGTPLVLLHALGLDSRQWRWQLDAFAANHRVITVDLRGHGSSGKPAGPYAIGQMAADVRGFFGAIGIDAADIIGLSMGGMVAQALALDHPTTVRSLILADTTCEYPPEARQQFEARARMAETQGMAPLAAAMPERWFPPEFIRDHPNLVGEIQAIVAANDASAYAAACRAVGAVDFGSRIGEIRCPTLVVVGDSDPGTPPAVAARLQQSIPGARLTIIEHASHLSNICQPAAFNAAGAAFLG